MILDGFGTNLHDFCSPGDGIASIRWIFMTAPGYSQILRPAWVVVTRGFLSLDSKTIEAET